MHVSSEQLALFNNPDTVLVLSKYPYRSNAVSHHGVATYTRDVLRALAKKTDTQFVVFVEDTFTKKIYQDTKNILVVPAFSDGYWYPLQILCAVAPFSNCRLLHIHSEFITSGNPVQMALLMPLLATLKLLGKQIFFTAHNVIDDFGFIASHLGKKRTDVTLKVLKPLMPWYYRMLSLLVDSIIALDSSVEKRLSKLVPESKLYTSPHWVKTSKISEYEQAYWRKKMGYTKNDFVIICFGFMTKYKGVDWLSQTLSHVNQQLSQQKSPKKVKLILAGGKAASMVGKAHYESFYNQLAQTIAASQDMVLTGFIPDSELKHYFAAADLVVLPYRGILGASGSWAQALAYGKPFLLSKDLEPYMASDDISDLLNQHKLQSEDILFVRNRQQFAQKLLLLMHNSHTLKKLAVFSTQLGKERSAQVRIPIELQDLYTARSNWVSRQINRVNRINQKLYTRLVLITND